MYCRLRKPLCCSSLNKSDSSVGCFAFNGKFGGSGEPVTAASVVRKAGQKLWKVVARLNCCTWSQSVVLPCCIVMSPFCLSFCHGLFLNFPLKMITIDCRMCVLRPLYRACFFQALFFQIHNFITVISHPLLLSRSGQYTGYVLGYEKSGNRAWCLF